MASDTAAGVALMASSLSIAAMPMPASSTATRGRESPGSNARRIGHARHPPVRADARQPHSAEFGGGFQQLGQRRRDQRLGFRRRRRSGRWRRHHRLGRRRRRGGRHRGHARRRGRRRPQHLQHRRTGQQAGQQHGPEPPQRHPGGRGNTARRRAAQLPVVLSPGHRAVPPRRRTVPAPTSLPQRDRQGYRAARLLAGIARTTASACCNWKSVPDFAGS